MFLVVKYELLYYMPYHMHHDEMSKYTDDMIQFKMELQ